MASAVGFFHVLLFSFLDPPCTHNNWYFSRFVWGDRFTSFSVCWSEHPGFGYGWLVSFGDECPRHNFPERILGYCTMLFFIECPEFVEFMVYSIPFGLWHLLVHSEALHQKALPVFSATCCSETQRRSVLCCEWMVDYLVGGSNCFKVCFVADCFKVCFLTDSLVGPILTTNNHSNPQPKIEQFET